MGSKSLTFWWLPLVALVLMLGGLVLWGDVWLADRIYAWEGGRWALKSAWLTENVLHTAARRASIFAWLSVVAVWAASQVFSRSRKWRRAMGYVALAVALSTGIVSGLKSVSPAPCPWDLSRYGGAREVRGPWQVSGVPPGRCAPAGHASAGYAWLALFFGLGSVKPAWRYRGLALGVSAGLVLGIDQQLRGAHFASHDLAAALVCWSVSFGLYLAMLKPRRGEVTA